MTYEENSHLVLHIFLSLLFTVLNISSITLRSKLDFVNLELKLYLVISKKYLIENILQVTVSGTKCKKYACFLGAFGWFTGNWFHWIYIQLILYKSPNSKNAHLMISCTHTVAYPTGPLEKRNTVIQGVKEAIFAPARYGCLPSIRHWCLLSKSSEICNWDLHSWSVGKLYVSVDIYSC